ncbi:DNA-directed RNA polymerase subunit omega [Tyzzerella sp. An114]|uniref:DNA-directed RNA polymerase subunit omega n=1 Tax=Tyzzerella sp. An114 TaxID=1965545 RepID=UPI000B4547AC|nr:DNA-directed RNA polymerase subunit omega [Tyzzerella sp. An114]OUQ58852.1 DNA-directed RNA polymerase subunit omega [Tyzzerella sp. An114]HIT73591.1 DNA-directed RNA polymerase subunit omega [Candidatus Fimicola cottocaccae]
MLRPSYSDLLEVLNKDASKVDAINSRYTIVIAAAKRARQLIDKAEPLTMNYTVDKPVSIAVNELFENKIKIIQNSEKAADAETSEQEEFTEE